MSKAILKQTETDAIVKIYGTSSTDTIALATDLLSTTMAISGTPTVNIIGVSWYESNGEITVTRNSVEIFRLGGTGQLDLANVNGISDNIQNTSDLVVSITGTGGIYLKLRKAAGYATKREEFSFGQYDNPNVVGS